MRNIIAILLCCALSINAQASDTFTKKETAIIGGVGVASVVAITGMVTSSAVAAIAVGTGITSGLALYNSDIRIPKTSKDLNEDVAALEKEIEKQTRSAQKAFNSQYAELKSNF